MRVRAFPCRGCAPDRAQARSTRVWRARATRYRHTPRDAACRGPCIYGVDTDPMAGGADQAFPVDGRHRAGKPLNFLERISGSEILCSGRRRNCYAKEFPLPRSKRSLEMIGGLRLDYASRMSAPGLDTNSFRHLSDTPYSVARQQKCKIRSRNFSGAVCPSAQRIHKAQEIP